MGLCPQASVWVSFWGLQKPGAATGSTPLPFLRHAEGAAGRAAGVSTTALPQVPHVLVPSHPLQAPQIGRVASSATLPRACWAFSPEVSQGRAGRTLESPRPFWLSLSGHLAPSPCPHTVKPALVAAVRTANQVAWLVLADTGLGLLSPIRKAFVSIPNAPLAPNPGQGSRCQPDPTHRLGAKGPLHLTWAAQSANRPTPRRALATFQETCTGLQIRRGWSRALAGGLRPRRLQQAGEGAPARSEVQAGVVPASDHRDPGRSAGRGRWAAAQPMPRDPRPAPLSGSEPRLGAATPRHAIRKPPPPAAAIPTRRTHLEMGGQVRVPGSRSPGSQNPGSQGTLCPQPSSPLGRPVGGSQGPRLRQSPASTSPTPSRRGPESPGAATRGLPAPYPPPESNHPVLGAGEGARQLSRRRPHPRGAHSSSARSSVWWVLEGQLEVRVPGWDQGRR